MARLYDHFHVRYLEDTELNEIEGGWTGYPNDWDTMTKEEHESWLYETAVAWGMPRGCEIIRFWLAG